MPKCNNEKAVALIVEDRPEVAAIWTKHLEPLGMEIRWAETLRDAMFLSKKIPPPDLILLDLRLTDSNDENTLKSIKELTSLNPGCAVLVLSGFIDARVRELAMLQGAHSVIEKLSIGRATDLWCHIKSYLDKAPQSVQQKMSCTADLIEKLSKTIPLI